MIFKIYKNDYGIHIKIRVFNLNFNSKIHLDYKLTTTAGIRNITPDGKRILFIDYDNNLLEHLIEEIKYLQNKYKLSDFYVFRASQKPHSYHAICLDKHNYKEFLKIIGETSSDEYYKHMPIINDQKTWVLRILKKEGSKAPELIKVLKSPYSVRNKSKSHYLLLKYHYKANIRKPPKLDKNTKLYTIVYDTLNYLPKNI